MTEVVQAFRPAGHATYAMTYWTGLILWAISRIASKAVWARLQTRFMLAAIGASSVLLIVNVFIGLVWKAKADNLAIARLAVAADVDDDEWVATLHPMTSTVYATATKLRAMGDPDVTDPDRAGIVQGLARPAPLVTSPNPSESEVVSAVWSSLRRRREPSRQWLGFVQRGGGEPYTFYVVDGRGDVVCQAATSLKPAAER